MNLQKLFVQTRKFTTTRFASSLFTKYLDTIRPSTTAITSQDLKANMFSDDPIEQKFTIVDCRETYEYNEESIPTSTYISKGTIERDIESVVPSIFDPIVVYCAAGPRSVLVTDVLQKMGYQNVRYLEGGIKGWKNFGGNVDENYGVYTLNKNE